MKVAIAIAFLAITLLVSPLERTQHRRRHLNESR
jgi:hypothetical protein